MPTPERPTGSPYSQHKLIHHLDRIEALRRGEQPAPLKVQLVLSDLCNQSCDFCAFRQTGYTNNELFAVARADGSRDNNPKRLISIEKVQEILRDCAAMGVKAIEFTGGGEPTVHPHHLEAFTYAKALGMDVALITNGMRLTDATSAWLAKYATWIRVSIDAGTAQTYASIRHVPESAFEKTWRHVGMLASLIQYRRKSSASSATLGIGFVVTKDNYLELPEAAERAWHEGADYLRISAVFTPQDFAYFEPVAEEARRCAAQAERWATDTFKVHNLLNNRFDDLIVQQPTESDCGIQHLTTFIGADLNVYTCCNTAYSESGLIGSLKQRSFRELWESEQKRQMFAAFDATKCDRCMFRQKNDFIRYAIAKHPKDVNFI